MAETPPKFHRTEKPGRLRRILPLALLLAGLTGVFATGLHRSFNLETFIHYQAGLQELVAAHHWTMLGLFGLIYVVAVTLSLPVSAFLTTIGGYLFGWALGGIAASMAATLGAINIFLIARSSLGRPLLQRAGARIQGLAAGFRRQAFLYLLSLRLIPIVPFWLTNLAAAFFGMRLRPFILATQLGMLPVSFAFAFAGSGLDEVISRQESLRADCLATGQSDCAVDFNAGSLLTPELMIALAILGILALVPVGLRHWRRRVADEG
ncbi:TVP38/TMEM64 family protein [Microvirga sp. VF16]|uniref:TVP38/TMEM64 family protein n=1 Tax=Microvirga sp. VF16 TaxID=2807101 RepID=UPI00193CF98A|nr:VTT domain-containing protein [Microvirga sp. VF16]QRM30560.1 TVP38/TMEM64 family protein [Microvirga sp. VF16]